MYGIAEDKKGIERNLYRYDGHIWMKVSSKSDGYNAEISKLNNEEREKAKRLYQRVKLIKDRTYEREQIFIWNTDMAQLGKSRVIM